MTFNDKAVEVIKARKTPVQSWFMDLMLVINCWTNGSGVSRVYHHTALVNALYGLHEPLVMLQEEGIENSWARHRKNSNALRTGFQAMGLELLVGEETHLPQLATIRVPEGVDSLEVRRYLLNNYNLEVGAGLGDLAGKIWRIGLMGESSSATHVILCLSVFEGTLSEMQTPVTKGEAVPAAQEIIFDF